MKTKLITALIIAILLSITVGNTALAIKLNCSTCGCWQEATFLGYVYWDNRYHCEKILCNVCNNVTEWWQTPHEASIAATCTERAYCNICQSYFGKAAGHSWGAWTSNGDGTHTRTCQREGCDETETKDCSGGTATCVSKAICEVCNSQYGALDRNAHNWGAWISNGNGTHTRTCKNDSSHAETQDCSGGTATCVSPAYCDVCNSPYGNTDPNAHDVEHHKAKAATCLEKGWTAYDTCKRAGCGYTTYKEIPALEHEIVKHDAKAPTCTEIGWDAYETCKRDGCNYTTYKEIPALEHEIVKHDAKAPTCTEIGWDAYETCKRDGCNYTTYKEISALEHEIVKHDAKAPTCTEKGWNEYDTCSRCSYTTYAELPALNHDLVPHAAKAPTCLDIGWNEYNTCSRCSYTTYAELPALGHDYQMTIVEPTCVKNGYTLAICSRCKDTYTDHPEQKLLHRYGEWSPSGDNTHSADCRRDGCKHTDKTNCRNLEFQTKENESLTFCPVCGAVENGERLERIKKVQTAAVTGKLPAGEAVVRMNGAYLSIAFEYGGELTAPTGQVKITLPAESAELPDGKILTVIAPDGSEMEIPVTTNDKGASFTLDFTDPEIPVMLIRTHSEA